MAYAKAQSSETVVVTKRADNVAKPIVAAVAAAGFQPDFAGWQVQLVVRDQDRFGRNFIKLRECGHRLPRAVHKGVWNQKFGVQTVDGAAADLAKEFCVGHKRDA